MSTLNTERRKQLETAVVAARRASEDAARAALNALAVNQDDAFPGMAEPDRLLRDGLRAEMKRLGNFEMLAQECAYEQWHRMLFARFLAENNLLMHPTGVPVTLSDCDELAADEGDADAWMAAARYAARMLPGIFRNEDPVLRVRFAAEGRLALETLLKNLPAEVFTADDSIGWVYQFWQTQKKAEVNKSGRKIGGADISPVTQLFTEPYMVRFLLENSLGAWWVARHEGQPLPWEDWLTPEGSYLRRNENGAPVAGGFPGWPATAKELRVLDPCCGSGHFLVDAFEMLRRMRMAEEGLNEADAADAVLRDNLFGLELDPRCTQIAAFNLAFAAWKAGGYRELPLPNIACSGLAVGENPKLWRKRAGVRGHLAASVETFHAAFRQAPVIGSLLDLHSVASLSGSAGSVWDDMKDILLPALEGEEENDPVAAVWGEADRGAARAVAILMRHYHLVTTNVPYLAAGKQAESLKGFIERNHAKAKADLATAFVERCLAFCEKGGSTVLVTPQNWLFLGSYQKLREHLLQWKQWDLVARLGPGAFETISGEVVNVALLALTNSYPNRDHIMAGLDASAPRTARAKSDLLRCGDALLITQTEQLRNPDGRISFENSHSISLLASYAISMRGIVSGDSDYWMRCYWERSNFNSSWLFMQSTVNENVIYGGREHVINWATEGRGMLRPGSENEAYNKHGIALGQMSALPTTLYTGELYDNNTGVIVPKDPSHLPAIWAYCSSPEYSKEVRKIDQKLNVTNATLVKVPFALEHWQKVALEKYPDGLPEPDSDDPTQWLFHGRIADCIAPLHAAVARLMGYQWPRQQGQTVSGAGPVPDDGLDALADADGIVCLPSVAGEAPAAERLRALLAAAYGARWSPAVAERLLDEAGHGGKDLAAWLRDGFFAGHCRLFHNRPFLWHVWDGLRDGFSAIVNYHTLDANRLNTLIYTYLGDWINTQEAADRNGEPGANGRLVAARKLQAKLEAIRDGEAAPDGKSGYDIYVRWKPLHLQPIGWNPDLNDGVRLNIRPFVKADVLRAKFTINWNKDRGTNPTPNAGGTTERLNDLHLTRAQKEEARRNAGAG